MSFPIVFSDDYDRIYPNYQFDYFLTTCQSIYEPTKLRGEHQGGLHLSP